MSLRSLLMEAALERFANLLTKYNLTSLNLTMALSNFEEGQVQLTNATPRRLIHYWVGVLQDTVSGSSKEQEFMAGFELKPDPRSDGQTTLLFHYILSWHLCQQYSMGRQTPWHALTMGGVLVFSPNLTSYWSPDSQIFTDGTDGKVIWFGFFLSESRTYRASELHKKKNYITYQFLWVF